MRRRLTRATLMAMGAMGAMGGAGLLALLFRMDVGMILGIGAAMWCFEFWVADGLRKKASER